MNKLVTIESNGPIKAMGGISGPIKTPTSVSITTIVSLINDNIVVYEVNPRNYSEKVRLTRLNINSINFKTITKEKIDNNKKIIKKNIQERVNNAKAVTNDVITPVVDIKKTETIEKPKPIEVRQKKSSTTISTPTKNTLTNSFVSNKNSRKKKRR